MSISGVRLAVHTSACFPAFSGSPVTSVLQGLLKEKLELEKVKTKDGRTRVTLKPIEDQLTFDKVIAHTLSNGRAANEHAASRI